MNNKIEVGCKAVIVKGLNKGTVVTVGNYIGSVDGFPDDVLSWEVNKPMIIRSRHFDDNDFEIGFHMCEVFLKRIDDNEQLSTWLEVEAGTGWHRKVTEETEQ